MPSTSCNGGNTYRLASPEAGASLILSSGAPEPRALSVSSSGMWENVASALHGGSHGFLIPPAHTSPGHPSGPSARFWSNSVEEGGRREGHCGSAVENIAAREAGGP